MTTPYRKMMTLIDSGKYNKDPYADFEADLLGAYGLTNNPKASKAFEIAWGFGHNGCLMDVLIYFNDIADLIG